MCMGCTYEPMSNTSRITVEVLRSGQPRAYADTEFVARATFERLDSKSGKWLTPGEGVEDLAKTPEGWVELNLDGYRGQLQAFGGWEDPPSSPFATRLDYMRQVGPGVIEWRTVSRYDD